ncbi:ABC-type cobalamin/Fe3+-siderophores transport system ATPase subunit [Streptomyces sp. LBL]|nr:ABC-type cobalamin/Fe3+-siderophores transport system ATPase subunit [Streptomyces sp. LBL]
MDRLVGAVNAVTRPRDVLLTVVGVSGAGKTTLVKAVASRLGKIRLKTDPSSPAPGRVGGYAVSLVVGVVSHCACRPETKVVNSPTMSKPPGSSSHCCWSPSRTATVRWTREATGAAG